MGSIVFAIAAVTVIGALCAVMLSIASKVMAVEVDERVERLREILPGANCGACGQAGCDGYAAALAEGAKANLCTPGGPEVARRLSEALGVVFEDVATKVAVLRCRGDCTVREDKMAYVGVHSCVAARQLFGGQSACAYGCIGFGDCAKACPNGAIRIINGIARINTAVCTGCGMCAGTCPNKLITVESDTIKTVVGCSNPEGGAAVRKVCKQGCIACGRCQRECPAEAILIEGNLAKIDYAKCNGCGHCAEICPTKCIQQASFAGIYN